MSARREDADEMTLAHADADPDGRKGSLNSTLDEKADAHVHDSPAYPAYTHADDADADAAARLDPEVELNRGLKGRHITMISLGGVLCVCSSEGEG